MSLFLINIFWRLLFLVSAAAAGFGNTSLLAVMALYAAAEGVSQTGGEWYLLGPASQQVAELWVAVSTPFPVCRTILKRSDMWCWHSKDMRFLFSGDVCISTALVHRDVADHEPCAAKQLQIPVLDYGASRHSTHTTPDDAECDDA